jgi:uncharacterized protein (DUF2147 family)
MIRPLILAATLVAAAAHAHEPDKGPNGGKRVDGGPYHVELAPEGATVRVFLSGPNYEPVSVEGFTGTAMLMIDGKPTRVTLTPAGDGMLAGEADAPVPAAAQGAVQLKAADGKTAQAKF